ncbi:MAG: efflux RND transporter periplasmic adaptor subunit [Bacteroidetes bacterium]|nr:efflux RND transporter periplasmic adaptor subunit [Bacteroidota bacterium]
MKKKWKFIKLLITTLVAVALMASSCSDNKRKQEQAHVQNSVKYTCPMHPQVLEDRPGNCPICGMALIKKSGQISEGAGINLNTVLQPVNSSVISDVPAIVPEVKEMPVEIKADGYLDYDTRMFNNIASRYSGRIEKLYIKYAFEEIHKGQLMMDIYSPDMVTAQQDLVFLVKNSPQETGLINAAKQKLLLLGMTDAQVRQVIKTEIPFYSLPVYSPYEGHVHDMSHSQMGTTMEVDSPEYLENNRPLTIREGMYVEKGQTMFNVVDLHKLWAIIKIDPSEIALVKLNQQVTITSPDLPDMKYSGKVNFVEPVLENNDKTTSIRVYLDNMDHRLKVNSLVRATIQTGQAKGMWVPRSAVLDLGQRKIVWLMHEQLYEAHEVTTGIIIGNQVQVEKGLSVTDSIASVAQYFRDNESFIKTQDHE